ADGIFYVVTSRSAYRLPGKRHLSVTRDSAQTSRERGRRGGENNRSIGSYIRSAGATELLDSVCPYQVPASHPRMQRFVVCPKIRVSRRRLSIAIHSDHRWEKCIAGKSGQRLAVAVAISTGGPELADKES